MESIQKIISSLTNKEHSTTLIGAGLGALAVGGLIKLYQKLYAPITIKNIRIFPIKSCRGFEVKEWEIGEYGFLYDRAWMVIKEDNNNFVTQRETPSMVLIGTSIDLKKGELKVSFPGSDDFSVKYIENIQINDENKDRVKNVTIWKYPVNAFDCGDEIAKWLSKNLKVSVRLVQVIDKFTDLRSDKSVEIQTHHRPAEPEVLQPFIDEKKEFTHVAQFADGYPFLLTSENSVSDFNKKVIQDQSNLFTRYFKTFLYDLFGAYSYISNWNFRGNIVISSPSISPYDEEKYREIEINGVTFYGVKRCSRCTMPSVDVDSGVKKSFITDSLNKHRFCEIIDGTVFGMNLCHNKKSSGRKISVGQRVTLKQVAFVQ